MPDGSVRSVELEEKKVSLLEPVLSPEGDLMLSCALNRHYCGRDKRSLLMNSIHPVVSATTFHVRLPRRRIFMYDCSLCRFSQAAFMCSVISMRSFSTVDCHRLELYS